MRLLKMYVAKIHLRPGESESLGMNHWKSILLRNSPDDLYTYHITVTR